MSDQPATVPSVTGAPTTTPAATAEWLNTLPEDLRGNDNIKTFKSPADLAKSYVEQKSLLGRKRLELPREDWKPEQHEEFWKTLGRPDSADAYAWNAKSENFTPDEKAIGEAKKVFHQAGLTEKQAAAIMDYYVTNVGEQVGGHQKAQAEAQTAAQTSLTEKWGDNYEIRLATARHFFKQMASPELAQHMESTGLANDPRMVELFYNVSKLKGEDSSAGAGAAPQLQGGAAGAQQKLASLKLDTAYLAKLTNRQHPEHPAALELWQGLHKQAAAA